MVRRRVLPAMGRLWALLGLLILAAWLTGRILTDEHLWSQYLFWMPTLWAVGAAALAWFLSWVFGLLATRMSGDLLRPLLGVAVILVAGWMLAIEWRAYRIVRLPIDPEKPSVRVAFWNNASKAHLHGAERDFEAVAADISVITNPTGGPKQRQGLLDTLVRISQPAAPEEAEPGAAQSPAGPVPELPPPSVHLYRRFGLVFASTMPILRVGDAWLEESEGADETWRTAGYGGRASFVELDASEKLPALGRPLVVWVIDLPSDPSLHKLEPAGKANAAISGFAGPVLEPDATGVMRRQGFTGTGFPPPDIVVGDFNTPRGSASLRAVVGAMGSAHDQGGFGPDVTWDQPFAWWAIDLMFVGDGLHAARFDAQLLNHHAHSLIVGDLVPRE